MRRAAVALLVLMPVLPVPGPDVGYWERAYSGQRLEIIFPADTYHRLPGGSVAFTVSYPIWASQDMLVDPNTRIYLVRDYDFLVSSDVSWNAHTKGMYKGWLYLNGTDPSTGMPQRLIEGGTDDWGDIAGCAGIDLFPDEIRLAIGWFHLFPPGPRDAGEIVSERDEWRLLVSFGPRPPGERYRCNADREGTLGL